MMAAIETPLGCLSRARTASCLVPLRVEPKWPLPDFRGLFARFFVRAGLVFLEILLCDILGSLSVATASGAVTTDAPQWRHRQRGRIQVGPSGPYQHADTDALMAGEVQCFLPEQWPDWLSVVVNPWPTPPAHLWIREFESRPIVVGVALPFTDQDGAAAWKRCRRSCRRLPALVASQRLTP
jgi:hypothetical protein